MNAKVESIEDIATLDGVDFPLDATPTEVYVSMGRGPMGGRKSSLSAFWTRVMQGEAADYTEVYRVIRHDDKIVRIGIKVQSAHLYSTWYNFK